MTQIGLLLLALSSGAAISGSPTGSSGEAPFFTQTNLSHASTFGPISIPTTAGAGSFKAPDILGCADVRAFGATGSALTTTGSISAGSSILTVASASDFAVGQTISVLNAGTTGAASLLVAHILTIVGTTFTLDTAATYTASSQTVAHDDTAAIQLTIATRPSSGGAVCFPSGTYRISGTLTVPSFVSLVGAWFYVDPNNGSSGAASIIDATGFGSGCNIPAVYVPHTTPNTYGVSVRNLRIRGPASTSGANTSCEGISINYAHGVTIENVAVDDFRNGIDFQASGLIDLRNVVTGLATLNGIMFSNSNQVEAWNVYSSNNCIGQGIQNPCANINIYNSQDVQFFNGLVDEQGGVTNYSATVLVYGTTTDKVTLQGMRVYYGFNCDGVMIGYLSANYPTHVTLRDVTVQDFAVSRHANYTIRIFGGSGHVLDNVTTVPNGGGDLVDLASDTEYINVTTSTAYYGFRHGGQQGTLTLTSGTPSTKTATVLPGSYCVCSNTTTQANPVKCAVSGTTLTATGPNSVTDTVAYFCF